MMRMRTRLVSSFLFRYNVFYDRLCRFTAFENPSWIHDELKRRGAQALVRSMHRTYREHCAVKKASPAQFKPPVQGNKEQDEHVLHSDYPELQEEIAFVALLKTCTNQENLHKGSLLHADVLKRGLLKNVFIGNTLVNLYARCGALAKTQQVFDELPIQTTISWTILISGYCQHGFGKQSLICFDEMQVEGLSPNVVTFLCSLKACSSIGALHKGREIHDEIVRRGLLGNDISLATALVDMYAKCGDFTKAHQVFKEVPIHDIVLWNVLIAGYIQHKHGEEALNCFEQIKREGLCANGVTYTCILRACGIIGAAEKGREIHNEISRQGLLGNDRLLFFDLVDMYVKLGALTKAQQVFDELPFRDVLCWNALITAYCQHGYGEDALNCFKLMKHEGLTPNGVTFACALKACGSIGAAEKGQNIHHDIVKNGLLGKDSVLVTALVDMYAKCGTLTKAKQMFDELLVQDVVAWNALVAGYCQHGRNEEALNYFECMKREGYFPNAVTFSCILKACGSLEAVDKGKTIHSEIVRGGLLEKFSELGNALVDMYTKCGALAMARQVFEQLPIQDVVSWTLLIMGYYQHGHGEEALNCYELMKSTGFSPDAFTFACILSACGSMGAAKKGEEIHHEIDRIGLLEKDNVLAIALMDMYAKCGALLKARRVFDKLSNRDVVSWNVLLAGYCNHGYGEEALLCFEQMNLEGFSPDIVSFACILKVCSCTGATEKGEEIYAEIVREGLLKKSSTLGSSLVDMYAKWGAVRKAQEVFDMLSVQDVVSWTALITGYAQVGKHDIVFELLNKMLGEGIEPNLVTLIVVLSACSHSGRESDGQMVFESMRTQGIIPTFEHHTCMVDLFSRAGHFGEAVDVIKKMPSPNHLPVWFALLGACQKWGYVKLGRFAFEHAVQLDESSAVPYLLMSNIYAAAGMQKEAKQIEGMRKKLEPQPSNIWYNPDI